MYDIYNVECITPKKEFLSSTQALVIQIDNSSIIIHWKKLRASIIQNA